MKIVLNAYKLKQLGILTGFVLFLLGVLVQSAFSREMIPDALVSMVPGSHAIVVEKSSQTLLLYSEKNGAPESVFSVPCSTGGNPGRKISEGDKKTPVGVYFITGVYEDRDLSPIYGKKAFPIDFPNYLDLKMGFNGSAIWLHGTNKELKPMDSNGCVALDNDNILALGKYVTLNSTPVVLLETINWTRHSDLAAEKEAILEMVHKWAVAATQGSYHDYLRFYASHYLPDIQWWDSWRTARTRIFDQNPGGELLLLDHVGIYRYEGVWVALFDFYLKISKEKIPVGRKKLFIENIDGLYKITGDSFQVISIDPDTDSHPLVAAAQKSEQAPDSDAVFIAMVNDWLSAWSSMDIKTYASYYAADFVSDGLNRTDWVDRKKRLAEKYSYIHITASDFIVDKQDQTCMVHFYQDYKSSGFSTQGTKTLIFVKKGGTWKISQENWKKN